MSEHRALIKAGSRLPVTRQRQLLDVGRSTVYYRAQEAVSADDLTLMRAIDESHLRYPFYGSRQIRDELAERGHGEEAIERSGRPQIFNTNRGAQFTSEAFTGVLKAKRRRHTALDRRTSDAVHFGGSSVPAVE